MENKTENKINEEIKPFAITDFTEDYEETIVNGLIPYNVFLYYYEANLPIGYENNTIPFNHANSLISIQYAPYFNANDLKLFKIPYDKERFGFNNDKKTPYVFRINQFENFSTSHPGTKEKLLGSFNCYPNIKNIGGPRSWKNESKLYFYPYSVGYLYDGLGDPIEIKYENCSGTSNNVYCRLALNINADYSIYIQNYHNDNNGEMEQNVITSSRDYPCSSNQYSNWLSTNKNSIQAQKTNSTMSGSSGVLGSVLSGALTGAAGGGAIGSIVPGLGTVAGAVAGGLVSGVGAGIGALTSNFNTRRSLMAQENDMRNVPPSLISKGSDITIGINTTEGYLRHYRYRQKDEFMQKIGDYFALYGYKQNKLMQPNTRNRYYYNFIKTSGANIEIINKVPLQYIDIIKNIFDNGVTIWHIDRSGVTINDFSNDNYEV